MFLLLIVDGDEENNYILSVYVADLMKDNPLTTLITEEKVIDVKLSVFFNEDDTAVYLSKEGVLE